MRTHPFRLIFALGFLFGIGLILFEAFRFAQFSSSAAQPGSAATAIVEIKKGEGPTEIAKQLASQGVISDARQFVWLGRLLREWKKVKAGEYQVSPGMTPMQLLDTITSGISINHPVTVREGENMYEIAQDIEAKGLATKSRFISLCRDPRFIASLGFQEPVPPTLEGYLYPETYFFNRTLASEDMIRQMVKKFLALWDSSRQSRAVSMGMTRHQIITMASIIEKETGAPQERPMISSVFYNRLKPGSEVS